MFLAQGEETAERLRAIGAEPEHVRVVGNLKYDVRPTSGTPAVERLRPLLAGRRVVVAGSTLPGEEELLLDAWAEVLRELPEALLLIAPRHPDRFRAVGELAEGRGRRVLRVSTMRAAEAADVRPGGVLLLDTIGDLAAVYGLATVAFVGGSLVEAGGHNPLEPARFGVPVVIGSSFQNFRQIVDRMRAIGGIRVVSSGQLAETMRELLRDVDAARELGERGRAVFAEQAGATERTVVELLALLNRAAMEGQR
ncbi:MAG: hypothetical protein NVSMB3_02570 [Acidobacteriaceae bacterium]